MKEGGTPAHDIKRAVVELKARKKALEEKVKNILQKKKKHTGSTSI